ncbi:MAG: MBL fold metallo-hydrolase [Candidatus Atribacteria bacterium]|nr:MBL fold metallo-hydrolase [Candidatus Atribacteria bacterium]
MKKESMGTVDQLKIVSLIENSPKYDSYLKGCNGISFWVELTSGNIHRNILFDVGPVAEPVIYNAKQLNLKLSEVDMIVLSHCHFDHTAALAGVLPEIGHEVPIFAHPDLFRPNFTLRPEFMNYAMVAENRRENIEKLGGYFVLTKSPIEPIPGFMISGEIERTTDFEETGGVSCFTIDHEGNLVPDQLKDDYSLIINVKNKGIVIITGCGHAGPVNIIKHSLKVSGIDKLDGIMGGFHLLQAENKRIDLTIQEFKKYKFNWIAPMHCTGTVPTAKIALNFKDEFREIHVGDIIDLP